MLEDLSVAIYVNYENISHLSRFGFTRLQHRPHNHIVKRPRAIRYV